MKRIPGDGPLTNSEAAALLFVHRRTMARWADEGRIPVMWTLGGHRRYARADVERLLNERNSR